MGQPAPQHRRKSGEEASDQVAEKDHKDVVIVLMLFLACYLPPCICIYNINFGPDPFVDFDYWWVFECKYMW